MNQLGPDTVTPDQLSALLASFTGPMFMSFQVIQFGWPETLAAGSFATHSMAMRVAADGNRRRLANGSG